MRTSEQLWKKLRKSKKYREEFVAEQVKRGIPFQIRTLMKQGGLSQEELAGRSGLTQGVISRAASPSYGNLTLNTIVRIAAGFDIAYVGRFVPFSELATWLATLSEEAVAAKNFTEEDAALKAGAAETSFTIVDMMSGKFIGHQRAIGQAVANGNAWRHSNLGATLTIGQMMLGGTSSRPNSAGAKTTSAIHGLSGMANSTSDLPAIEAIVPRVEELFMEATKIKDAEAMGVPTKHPEVTMSMPGIQKPGSSRRFSPPQPRSTRRHRMTAAPAPATVPTLAFVPDLAA